MTLPRPRVAIVGGGLAGLAAAVGLADHCQLELFEARSYLGGRASSFRDPDSGELVDQCQHVSMGCCTNLTDFFRRTGIEDLVERHDAMHFVAPDGRRYRLKAARWLPAPLHLAPGFARLGYLSLAERLGIAKAMWRLWRTPPLADAGEPTIAEWLYDAGQTARAIEQFWGVVLVSALGERLERIALSSARKVLADGFCASAQAYRLYVPRVALADLYGGPIESWLSSRDVVLHCGAAAKRAQLLDDGFWLSANGSQHGPFQRVVVALGWRQIGGLFDESLAARLAWLPEVARFSGAPITGVHLWFDRPILDLPHAALVGRLAQWVFGRGETRHGEAPRHYYQVVISASHALAGRPKQAIVDQVRKELGEIWPAAKTAILLGWRVITEPAAVFSPAPGVEALRPAQRTSVPGLYVAGDWTSTLWPATMESAVRSGYLAAERLLEDIGRPTAILAPDLNRSWLARRLIV